MTRFLAKEIEDYKNKNRLPFHMPGNKRRKKEFENDFTEIDSLDNLLNAKGVLKNEIERLLKLYGAKDGFLLTNGSSSGMLTAICGSLQKNEEVLVASNSHISTFNAIFLGELKPTYITPEVSGYFSYKISAESIKKCLDENEKIKAVILTSPTYEGFYLNILEIARVTKEKNVLLIVDAAHAAHFPFSDFFPEFPREADIVVTSFHKTLPTLTPSAGLFVYKENVNVKRLKHYFHIFQTTSPPYPLMKSVSECFSMIEEDKSLFKNYEESLLSLREMCKSLRNIKLIDTHDKSKLLFLVADGKRLKEELAKNGIEIEMNTAKSILLMTSCFDDFSWYVTLFKILKKLDATFFPVEKNESKSESKTFSFEMPQDIYNAKMGELKDAIGKISAKNVCIYPPGVPTLFIGEKITEEKIKKIKESMQRGDDIIGLEEEKIAYIEDKATIYFLMGRSASGKNHIQEALLLDESLLLEQVVLYTTRPRRKEEEDGKDYHFVDLEKIKEYRKENKIIEERIYHTKGGDWIYATVKDETFEKNKNLLVIGTLESYEKYCKYFGNERVVPIYISVDEKILLERAIKREEKEENPNFKEVKRRFYADGKDFLKENLEKLGIKNCFENNGKIEDCIDKIKSFLVEFYKK